MGTEREQIEATIRGLEAQRALLGDSVVDAAVAPLRSRLAAPDPAPHSSSQTLKQVTVLFLDVVGSTALGQNLDPEEIQVVMDGALASCTSIVESRRGKVLRYSGDNFLAVFGLEGAEEDDPERAVRTGLDLLTQGRVLAEEIQNRYGHADFNVRVGIHTGGVLIGSGVDAQSNVWGNSVNIAARMEQTAPTGALRISHDTYRHVRGVFDVEPQAPIDVKGVSEPIITYLVMRAKPRAFRVATRGIEGVETRMIGRDAELEIIQHAFKCLFSDPGFQAITVVGEPGVGKSRLLYEFENWIEPRPERFYLFQGRASPRAQSQPYGLLRDILRWRFQLSDTDSMQAAKDKLEVGIAHLFVDDEGPARAQAHAHVLGHLVGFDFAESRHVKGILDDAKQLRNRGFHAAAQMFRRVSAKGNLPILLDLEDVQWADEASLDFLDYLAQVNRDVPMLVLSLARPTLFERRTDWIGAGGPHQRIDLHSFGREHSRDLANELLKKLPEIPGAIRELITGGAEGNPFYMEELVKMLVDHGAIEIGPEQWAVHGEKLLTMQVPPTLTGVLQTRLDGLPEAERLALQQASVIGATFWDAALNALDSSSPATLPALVQRELVIRSQSEAIEGMREYSFKHQILHQVVYDTILKRDRRELHTRAAAWLIGLTGSRAGEFLGETAEHLAKAGERNNAAEYFTQAAEQAYARFAHNVALNYVDRALLLFGDRGGDAPTILRWRLLDVRERTLDRLGNRREQRTSLDELHQIADTLDDDYRRALVAWRRSHLAMRMGDWNGQEQSARQSMAFAEAVKSYDLKLNAQRLLASAMANRGDSAAGLALAQAGLAEARLRRLPRAESLLINTLNVLSWARGDSVAALEYSQLSLAMDREIGDRYSEAVALCNIADSSLMLGDFETTRVNLKEGLTLARTLGLRPAEILFHTQGSRLAWYLGEDTQALTSAHEALEIAIATDARHDEAAALWCIGNAELALGRQEEAMRAFASSKTLSCTHGFAFQHDATAGLARVALAAGDVKTAMSYVEGLLAHLQGGGTWEGTRLPRLILLSCYQILVCADDTRATAVLAAANANLRQCLATISDERSKERFLSNIPENRAIQQAWAAQESAAR